jgi:hypothetical protein
VLGEAYATIRQGSHELILYRNEIDLPYVNKRDNRMPPNTFEGYKVRGKFSLSDMGVVEYGGGLSGQDEAAQR